MVHEVATHVGATTTLRTVVFAVVSPEAEQAFAEALKDVEALER